MQYKKKKKKRSNSPVVKYGSSTRTHPPFLPPPTANCFVCCSVARVVEHKLSTIVVSAALIYMVVGYERFAVPKEKERKNSSTPCQLFLSFSLVVPVLGINRKYSDDTLLPTPIAWTITYCTHTARLWETQENFDHFSRCCFSFFSLYFFFIYMRLQFTDLKEKEKKRNKAHVKCCRKSLAASNLWIGRG